MGFTVSSITLQCTVYLDQQFKLEKSSQEKEKSSQVPKKHYKRSRCNLGNIEAILCAIQTFMVPFCQIKYFMLLLTYFLVFFLSFCESSSLHFHCLRHRIFAL